MKLLAAAVVLAAACGDNSLRPVAFEDYPAAAIDALCAFGVRCRYEPDDATCRRFVDAKHYDLRHAADAIAAGRLRYDPDAAARCLDVGANAFCGATPFDIPECVGVFTGLLMEGQPCGGSAECAGYGTCLMPVCNEGCCTGTCGPAAPFSTTHPEPIGAACAQHSDCTPDAFCDLDQICRALPDAPGEHCVYGCTYGDLYCDVSTLTCMSFAPIGAPCPAGTRCNPDDSFCDGSVCQPRPGAGEPCDPTGTTDELCTPDTSCDPQTSHCAARGGPGAPCSADGDCVDACDTTSQTCVAHQMCAL